jgi:ABC-type nitrate/sulfonate/bicarbonate transport system substrate-binding protein
LLSCWVASADYIAKNPDLVNGFVAGLLEAARLTNANQGITTDLIAAFTGQDPALVGGGIRSTTAETITLADMQRPLDFALKYGIIDKTFDITGLLAPSISLYRSR